MVTLLERFKSDASKTRSEVRMELGITGESLISDFPVTTPHRLTQAEYIAFLDGLPVHPSELYFAVESNRVEEVVEFLRKSPNLDVNWRGEDCCTAFNLACRDDRRSPVIPLLLTHPGINVNAKDVGGYTPFWNACRNGHASCVRELLKDPRVKVNEPAFGSTPLWCAACYDHLDVILWWIGSGREMDLGYPEDIKTDAIWVAKKNGNTGVATQLKRFKSNASQTRYQVRLEIGWYDETAAEMFALVVFVSDELLKIEHSSFTRSQVLQYCRKSSS